MSEPVAFEPESFRLGEDESHILPDGRRFVRKALTLGGVHKVWTNVEYSPTGECLGGDSHWLSPRLADEALRKTISETNKKEQAQ